jgi:hypothetical protein
VHAATLVHAPPRQPAPTAASRGALAESQCSRYQTYERYTQEMLAATKADSFTLEELQAVTEHAEQSYLRSVKLHQLVFTEEQTTRESHAELFLQTPAAPPATADAVDPDSLPPPAPAEEAAPVAEAAAEPEAAPTAVAEAPAEAVAAEGAEAAAGGEAGRALEDDALTAAISATISDQVARLQTAMAAEYAAKEQQLLDRIAALETKVG